MKSNKRTLWKYSGHSVVSVEVPAPLTPLPFPLAPALAGTRRLGGFSASLSAEDADFEGALRLREPSGASMLQDGRK
jgi:hypothetical protein